MEVNEKILSLAKKLKALSDQGVGGEKTNAATMLESLMKKHSITMDMLSENEVKQHEFRLELEKKRFFLQVVASVVGRERSYLSFYPKDRAKKRHYFIDCTPQEAVEIQGKFDFFWKKWEDELDVFYSAFIQQQRLYCKPAKEEEDDESEDKELTPAEKSKLYRMANMMAGMDRHIYQKQLTK